MRVRLARGGTPRGRRRRRRRRGSGGSSGHAGPRLAASPQRPDHSARFTQPGSQLTRLRSDTSIAKPLNDIDRNLQQHKAAEYRELGGFLLFGVPEFPEFHGVAVSRVRALECRIQGL